MAHIDIHKTSPHALADLMRASTGDDPPWNEQDLAAMLRHQLTAPFEGGPPIGELFAQAQPAVESLRQIKDFAKSSRQNARSPLPEQIASVLYFASIVLAWSRLGQRISTQGDEQIRQGATWIIDQAWVDDKTRGMVREALARWPAPG